MAPIVRQNWSELRDEVQLRMGKANVTEWTARIERFLTSAYYDIALTWHHYELEKAASFTLGEGASSITLTNEQMYSIMSVRLVDSSDRLFTLGQEHVKFLFQGAQGIGRPENWARTNGDTILLDKTADGSYDVEIYFYRYPLAPDFEAPTDPETGTLWDEHIMQRAMFLAAPATWRYDMSQVQAQTLQEFLDAQPQASNKTGLVARAEVPLTSSNQGGGQ